jgi:hypothetical protein
MRRWLLWVLISWSAAACLPDPDALPTLAVLPPTSPGELIPLAFWETQPGRVDADTHRTYILNAQAGDNIRVGAVATGAPLTLALVDINGAMLTSGRSVEARIPADGLYRVIVSAEGVSEYVIGLSYTDRPNPNQPTPISVVVGVPTPTPDADARGVFVGELLSGQPITGALTAREPSHLYRVALRAGQFFTVEMSRVSGTTDPYLRLFAPDDRLIAEDDNAGGNRSARLLNVRAEAAGVYLVQASGLGTFGEYRLALTVDFVTPAPDPTPTPRALVLTPYATPTLAPLAVGRTRLVDHVPALGSITTPRGFQEYSFLGDAGQAVSVGVSPFGTSGIRPMFEIFDPDGALVASARSSRSNDRGSASLPLLRLPQTGAYLVIVTGEDNTTGSFAVSYGVGPSRLDVFKGSAPAESRLTSTLTNKAVRDVWTVTLQAGDVITVAASSADGVLDPFVELTDLDGVPLAADDNGGGGLNAVLRSVPIERSGQYLIRVRAARGDQVGGYQLLWRYINLAQAADHNARETTLMQVDGTIRLNEYEFYYFYGLQGQTIHVSVFPRPGSRLDPVAVLFDATDNLIAEGDDDDGLNPSFTVTLPTNGTYTLRVNGYLTEGDFTARVKWRFQ